MALMIPKCKRGRACPYHALSRCWFEHDLPPDVPISTEARKERQITLFGNSPRSSSKLYSDIYDCDDSAQDNKLQSQIVELRRTIADLEKQLQHTNEELEKEMVSRVADHAHTTEQLEFLEKHICDSADFSAQEDGKVCGAASIPLKLCSEIEALRRNVQDVKSLLADVNCPADLVHHRELVELKQAVEERFHAIITDGVTREELDAIKTRVETLSASIQPHNETVLPLKEELARLSEQVLFHVKLKPDVKHCKLREPLDSAGSLNMKRLEKKLELQDGGTEDKHAEEVKVDPADSSWISPADFVEFILNHESLTEEFCYMIRSGPYDDKHGDDNEDHGHDNEDNENQDRGEEDDYDDYDDECGGYQADQTEQEYNDWLAQLRGDIESATTQTVEFPEDTLVDKVVEIPVTTERQDIPEAFTSKLQDDMEQMMQCMWLGVQSNSEQLDAIRHTVHGTRHTVHCQLKFIDTMAERVDYLKKSLGR